VSTVVAEPVGVAQLLAERWGWTDVGPRGRARVSSRAEATDGWKPGDAQHAVRPGTTLLSGRQVGDYAFCTGEGAGEYWELELPADTRVGCVILHNALGAAAMDRPHLRIESMRRDGGAKTYGTEYVGEIVFGAEPASLPLVVPFDEKLVDGVRVRLTGDGRLRLFRAEVLGEAPSLGGRYVLCRPRIGGLADVLNQVALCHEYSVVHGRTLYVDGRQSGLHDELDRYFEFADERVVLHSMESALYGDLTHRPHFLDALPMDYRVTRDKELRRVVVAGTRDVVSFDLDRPHDEEVLVHHQIGGYKRGSNGKMRSHEVWKRLRLAPRVRDRVVGVLEQAGDYDAVHVRNTDIQTDYERLFDELDGMLGERIVLATDDHGCRTYAERLWGSRLLPATQLPDLDGTPLHYAALDEQDRVEVNIATLTDLMLLAGARRLFFKSIDRGEKQGEVSGFSSMAQYLHDHPDVRAAVLGSATKEGRSADAARERRKGHEDG